MALRLEAWLGKERGGDARMWLGQQTAHEIWRAEQKLKKSRLRVRPAP
jgi:plasmid maintenance system antidote protein VapI